MADIEERAGKWARKRVDEVATPGVRRMLFSLQALTEALTEAYLAGSAQTQADYTADPGPAPGTACERHGNVGCAWCIPGPFECSRCECSCGAR